MQKNSCGNGTKKSARKSLKESNLPKRVYDVLDELAYNFYLDYAEFVEFERNGLEHHFDKIRELGAKLKKADMKGDDDLYQKIADEIVTVVKRANGTLEESKKSARKSIKEKRFPKLDEFNQFCETDDKIIRCEWEDTGIYTIFCKDDVDIEKLAKEMILDFNGSHYILYNKSSMPHLDKKYPNHFAFYFKWTESKKSARKSIKESRQSILDKRFYELVDEGYIYDEDENGMNMSYGELVAVSDDLWETLEDELKYYDDFQEAYDVYMEIMNNTSDDAKMFMTGSDEYFYFEADEDEGTYSVDGEVPFVLEKLFKQFQKNTDLVRR